MLKRVKHHSELPSWFQLEKYAKVTELDTLGWYWQIYARSMLYNHFVWFIPDEDVDNSGWSERHKRGIKEDNKMLMKFWDIFRSDPILARNSSELDECMRDTFFPFPNGGVDYASKDDLYKRLHHFSLEELENVIQAPDRRGEVKFPKPCPYAERQKEDEFEVLLSVDLNFPERILMENFKKIIQRAKALRAKEQIDEWDYRQLDFKEWERIGLLPYLDLQIWAFREEKKITNRVMADAIFSHGEGGEEVVRKTTSKLGEKVLDGAMWQILAGVCFTEMLDIR